LGGPRGRMISNPDRIKVIELINEARQAGARLEPACQVINISTRTYERWVKEGTETKDKRPFAKRKPPVNKLTTEEKDKIINVCNQPNFADLTPAQIVPKLADKGEYIASEATFYRVLREVKQNTKRVAVNNSNKKTITTHIATAPNQVWSWDITWLPGLIKGHYYKLYLILDIFSRLIINWEIHEKESQKHAQELVKKAIFKHGVFNTPLVLHSDNGSPMKAQDFQNLLSRLGITKSYSRPRVSNDNPYSESLFKTLKYTKDFPNKGFKSLEEARKWVYHFVNLYNTEFLHSGIKFVTPHQRHYGLDIKLLEKRNEVYKKARAQKPERWSKGTRDWSWIDQVALNPAKESEETLFKKMRQLS